MDHLVLLVDGGSGNRQGWKGSLRLQLVLLQGKFNGILGRLRLDLLVFVLLLWF